MLYVPNTSVLPQIQASNMSLQNALLNRSMAEPPRQRYVAPKLPLDPNNPSTWPNKLPPDAFGTPAQTRAIVEGHFGNKKTGKKASGMLVGDKWNTNAGWAAEDKKMAERVKRDAMARRGTVMERDTPLWGTPAYDAAVREEENRKAGIAPVLDLGANRQGSQRPASNSSGSSGGSGSVLGNFFKAAGQQPTPVNKSSSQPVGMQQPQQTRQPAVNQPQGFNQLAQALNRMSGNTTNTSGGK